MIENLSLSRMAVLLVVALVIFGPDRLPEIAAQLGRFLRQARGMFDNMSSELKSSMGPELADADLRSLHPRRYLADLMDDSTPEAPTSPAHPDEPSGATAVAATDAPASPDAMQLLHSAEDWGGELPQEWLDALRDDDADATPTSTTA